MRIGIGYDVHRFDPSTPRQRTLAGRSGLRPTSKSVGLRGTRPLKLGGVTIPFAKGLSGHSDADVLLHALADALLGAVGAPDLGEQFPSSDPRYKNADSRMFVEAACRAIRRRGFAVGNVDATVIADAPRLVEYKGAMRRAISQLLKVSPAQVSVKAKTTEGFSPGKDGVAAQAVVLLKPVQGSGFRVRGRR